MVKQFSGQGLALNLESIDANKELKKLQIKLSYDFFVYSFSCFPYQDNRSCKETILLTVSHWQDRLPSFLKKNYFLPHVSLTLPIVTFSRFYLKYRTNVKRFFHQLFASHCPLILKVAFFWQSFVEEIIYCHWQSHEFDHDLNP